jgi:hypothetical protein
MKKREAQNRLLARQQRARDEAAFVELLGRRFACDGPDADKCALYEAGGEPRCRHACGFKAAWSMRNRRET